LFEQVAAMPHQLGSDGSWRDIAASFIEGGADALLAAHPRGRSGPRASRPVTRAANPCS
jgi:hypothetical protein